MRTRRFTWLVTLDRETDEPDLSAPIRYECVSISGDELEITASGHAVFWECAGDNGTGIRAYVLQVLVPGVYRSISVQSALDGSPNGWEAAEGSARF
jgi:hypothetical protein